MANFITTIWQGFLGLDYFWIIFILSVLATILTTVIYKYTTDQAKLKRIKKEMKEMREKQKKYAKDQKKLMQIQKEMMEKNMDMMKQSFKSMLYTFIPLILLFSWMAGALAYEPITPGQEFTITAFISESYPHNMSEIKISSVPALGFLMNEGYEPDKGRAVQWKTAAETEGTYTILIEGETFKETQEVLITNEKKYSPVKAEFRDKQIKSIVIGNKEVKPMEGAPIVGGFNWLWTYIVLSIIMSIALRKALDVA